MNNDPNPIAQLARDRGAAREQADPWAALCVVGTVDARQAPNARADLRTLVLRDLEGQLALFFSATSPKWQQLKSSNTIALLIYLPSLQLQYRLQATWKPIPAATVHHHWQMRPQIPKQLDWLYETHPQSTALPTAELVALLASDSQTEPPAAAPAAAMGIFVDPFEIDRLQLTTGVHERHLFTRSSRANNPAWVEQSLVP